MSLTKVNGIRISHDREGEGFPIILIHGFGAKKEIWKSQVGDLAKKYMTIAIDIRGSGESERPDVPYTMKMFADDIKGLMVKLKIPKAHIIGRSLGGMIAQNFALIYPEHVEKLVLITTNSKMPDDKAIDMLTEARIREVEQLKIDPEKSYWNKARMLYHHSFRKQMEAEPNKKFHGVWSVKDQIKESTINPSRPQDIRNQANAIKLHDVHDRLCKIKSPTLLIAASHDKLTPRTPMEEMNNLIPNSRLEIISKAGHFVTLSRAPKVNELILGFLG